MNVSREEKKIEALNRMKKMGYWGRARESFKRSGKVLVNEPPFGGVYEPEEAVKAAIAEFEEKQNALVYMVVRSFMEFGTMDSFLFVSDNKDDWTADHEDLRNGEVFTYTMNKDCPEESEFGYIGIRLGCGAGIIRVA